MEELLQLLTIADEWGLQDFKDLLQDKFISEYRIIEQLSNKHQTSESSINIHSIKPKY